MVHQERKDYDSSPKMKEKRAKASVSSFEFNEAKEARAPIKFVQKRDFLLPRRKESEEMVHEEQPFNSSKAKRRSGPSAAAGAQAQTRTLLPRKGLLLPCQMQDLGFFFPTPPMESIHLDSLPLPPQQ